MSTLYLLVMSLSLSLSSTDTSHTSHRAALVSLTGGGPALAGANRWHDKCIQLLVAESGECGMTYEHSPAEGPPLMILTDHIMGFVEGRIGQGSNLPAINTTPVEPLKFTITPAISEAIIDGKERLINLVEEFDLATLHFTNWGKTEIKALGFSPDSFIQMALQAAFYRDQGEPGAHYESGGTRKFLHGRTEVIRSCSIESVAFSKALDSGSPEAYRLMTEAISGHNSYARLATAGLGVDRHLQGGKLYKLPF